MTEFEKQVLKALENIEDRLSDLESAVFPFSHPRSYGHCPTAQDLMDCGQALQNPPSNWPR